MHMFCVVGVALAAVASLGAGDDAQKHNTLTEKEKADGWILLFDGKTTKESTVRSGPKPELAAKERTEVRDGVLVFWCKANEGTMILTKQPFHKFELRFEYRRSGKGIAEVMWLPLNGSTKKKDDVWNEFSVKYSGGLRIHGEEKEPGVGTTKSQTELFGDAEVALPMHIQVFPETKLYLRNIKIKKL
ncbi:MAG: DUF1080 domain-containing protein [Planctomycetes bacterium]|nr:DUF1080 domain-containing protein [Planctomycetota bacterium]